MAATLQSCWLRVGLPAMLAACAAVVAGCKATTPPAQLPQAATTAIKSPAKPLADQPVQLASHRVPAPELIAPPPDEPAPLMLRDVVRSVVLHYPLLSAAYESRRLAAGEQTAAAGAFDLKLKAESHNTPLGFYETYRQLAGMEQPLYHGGSLFAGYRVGRGNFEPWYLERQTNDGGEFKGGAVIPLLQNRAIDPRRAELWQSQWARRAVDPAIRAEVLLYAYEASLQYWMWIAAGRNAQIAQDLLDLALERQAGLEKQVRAGSIPRIELVDNQRLIVSREAKLVEARQKLEQSAIKLSLFYRDAQGRPLLPAKSCMPAEFPQPLPIDPARLSEDLAWALQNRPELTLLEYTRRQLEIDLAQARNLALPEVDAYVTASQDVGGPTSEKRDKSPLELETGLIGSVPLQRRKAAGKELATQAKLAQLSAKRRFTADKIATEVENTQVALAAAHRRVEMAHRATDLAQQMATAERKKLTAGDSDVLLVNIREQQAADAATAEVQASLDYFQAEAMYHAALAIDPL